MAKRQRSTAEFKREAVRLLDAGERPASGVAIDLGLDVVRAATTAAASLVHAPWINPGLSSNHSGRAVSMGASVALAATLD